jgi:preprotein translocase subunit YajC
MSIASPELFGAAPAGGDLIATWGLPILIFAIFYFLVIAPVRKREKARQQMIDEIKRGDKIITTGGLFGEIAAVEPTSVLLKIGDGVKVRLAKANIAGLQGEPDHGGAK